MKSEVDVALEELMILERALIDSDDANDDFSITSPRPDYLLGRTHSNIGNKRSHRAAYDNYSQGQVDGKRER